MIKLSIAILLSILLFSCGPSKEEVETIDSAIEVATDTMPNNMDSMQSLDPSKSIQNATTTTKDESLQKEITEDPELFLISDLNVEKRSIMEKDIVAVTVTNKHKTKAIKEIKFQLISYDSDGEIIASHTETISKSIKPTGSFTKKIDEDKLVLKTKNYKVKFASAKFN